MQPPVQPAVTPGNEHVLDVAFHRRMARRSKRVGPTAASLHVQEIDSQERSQVA